MPSSSAPSSSPSSSQQSSLYQYYTPIGSNDSSPPRALQSSTTHNSRSNRSRITIKRPLHSKPSTPSPAKKLKLSNTLQITSPLPENVPIRRYASQTLPRSLLNRGLQGRRGTLSQCTSLYF